MDYLVTPCTFDSLEADPAFSRLVEGYTHECAIPEFTPGEVQGDAYRAMEAAGVLHCFEVRAEGALVGFLTILLHVLPHFGVRTAIVESVYVDPDHRGAGLSVVREAKAFATQHNTRGLLMSAPAGGALARLLPRLGFRHTNETFLWVPA
jgi:GNAT superfamily N-acetyltransferase